MQPLLNKHCNHLDEPSFDALTAEEKKEDENQEAEFPEPIVQESDDNKSKEVDTSDDNALLMMLKMRRNESRKLNHAEVLYFVMKPFLSFFLSRVGMIT